MAISIAQLNEILQIDYMPGFVAQLNEDMSYFYKLMEQKDMQSLGSQSTFLATYGRSGGIGMISESGDLPTPRAAGRKQINLVPKNFGARFAISERLIRSSSTDAAFIEALDLEMKELQRDSKDNLNVQMFGDGTGIRAVVTEASVTDSATLEVDDTNYLFVNQVVDVVDASALPTVTKIKAGAVIIDVDRAGKKITIDAAIAVAKDDIITIANSYNEEITGLKAIMTRDNIIYNVNRASNKWFNPNTLTASSSVLVDDDIMEQAIQKVDFESGKKPDIILAGYFAYRTLKNYLSEFQRYVEIDTRYQAGHKTMSYDGIPVEQDKYQTTNVMDFLNMDSFNLMSIGKLFDWMDRDGSILTRMANKPAYEATLLSFAEIKNDHPSLKLPYIWHNRLGETMRKEGLIERMRRRGYKYIESDVYDISKRIAEHDEDLLLFFNPNNKRYEIHSCTFFPSPRPTYCVSAKELDTRLLDKLRMADNRTYGFEEKAKDVEESIISEEIQKQKAVEDIQKETSKDIKQRLGMKKHFHMGGD